nr:RING-H2 finger protein ATL51-like [Ipomoea batatas]
MSGESDNDSDILPKLMICFIGAASAAVPHYSAANGGAAAVAERVPEQRRELDGGANTGPQVPEGGRVDPGWRRRLRRLPVGIRGRRGAAHFAGMHALVPRGVH